MPRFVLLRHDVPADFGRPSHWDLMLEDGAELLTWALEQLPSNDCPVPAIRLAPHRIEYLDYEGPVSRARGFVQRRDAGTFMWLDRSETLLRIDLRGTEFQGVVTLRDDHSAQCWFLELSVDTSATRAD